MKTHRWIAIAWFVLFAVGCEPVWGPPPEHTTTVSGRVRWLGHAVGPGWVEFMPVNGTVGHLGSAQLMADGTFHTERVAVGQVAIRLVGTPRMRSADPVQDQFLRDVCQQFAIGRTFGSRPVSGMILDLETEAIRQSRLRRAL